MKRRTIATVETNSDEETGVKFEVSNTRKVTLRFPKAVYAGGYAATGYTDFVRNLTPEEAREIGKALLEAANEVESAQHVPD